MDSNAERADSFTVASPSLFRNTRQHRRAFIELPVATRSSSRPVFTHNISIGGTFIKTENPLPVGARFSFQLRVPPQEVPLEVSGEVVWSVAEGRQPGMGIRFLHGSDAQKQLLESLVNRLLMTLLGAP